MSFELPRYTDPVTQSQNIVDQPDHPEQEIFADEDGGRFFCTLSSVDLTPDPQTR